ncbi:hypothetical protein J40TS1_33640 [Paenibacillus montaniterrae]|uniref:YvaD family protein n=1 Tax=Paenibacillus montaniterrae TaxID=429341 RepID=A0A920CV47_9BACL|nr:DUF5360 family protein [Paenibacillus montaniterrae]GIP17722.1 hypothetical protein J40TS1_33640 [Paenibacillus montaniterrae]
MGKSLKVSMLITDVGFLAYWFIVLMGLLPSEFLYKDYDNPIMVAWNLSFIPLDLMVSLTGLLSIALFRRKSRAWLPLCIVSLSLTFCAGLQAISFWAIRGDFDIWWWLPNSFLIVYPLIFLPKLIRSA